MLVLGVLSGTREGGHWCHFTLREGVTENVLLAAKIRSEHWQDIAALLRRCGDPIDLPRIASGRVNRETDAQSPR